MRNTALFAGMAALCFLATVVDFTSKLLSVFADGITLAAVVWGAWHLLGEIRKLQQENTSLRRRLIAAGIVPALAPERSPGRADGIKEWEAQQ